MLDDYAFMIVACLDAYEASAALTYFNFAREIAETMIRDFHDKTSGGFFDIPQRSGEAQNGNPVLGALTASRKPLQDSPTPAGNPAAAIALLRLHAWTNDARYRDLAEDTLEAFAGIVEHYGLFSATYALALGMYLKPHTQVVITGTGPEADLLYATAARSFSFHKSVLHLREAVAQNLPPGLAETIPNLPGINDGKAQAVICTGFTCRPPVSDADELKRLLS